MKIYYTIKFELEIEFEDSNIDREKEVLTNQIDTVKCVLNHLFSLTDGENVRSMEIVEVNKQAWRRRKKLVKIQDLESKISTQIQN